MKFYKNIINKYKRYSICLVMSCRDNGYYTIESGWILSKNQEFRTTEMYKEVKDMAIEKFGFKTDDAIEGIDL